MGLGRIQTQIKVGDWLAHLLDRINFFEFEGRPFGRLFDRWNSVSDFTGQNSWLVRFEIFDDEVGHVGGVAETLVQQRALVKDEILAVYTGHFEKHTLVVAVFILVDQTRRRLDLNLVGIANHEERPKLGIDQRGPLNLLSCSFEIVQAMRILIPSVEVEFESKRY